MAPAAVFAFLGGLLIGSFLTVVAHRVPRAESIVGPRSRCPACGTRIAAYDNLPVVSWLALRGRARCCGTSISPRYPLTELTVGLLFLVTLLVLWDEAWEVALGLVFVSTLVAVTLTDLELKLIPNKILLVATALGLLIVAVGDPGEPPRALRRRGGSRRAALRRRSRLPAGHGARRRRASRGNGSLPGAERGPGAARGAAGRLDRRSGDRRRDGAAARQRGSHFGPFLALGGVVGLLAGGELIDLYLDSFT